MEDYKRVWNIMIYMVFNLLKGISGSSPTNNLKSQCYVG